MRKRIALFFMVIILAIVGVNLVLFNRTLMIAKINSENLASDNSKIDRIKNNWKAANQIEAIGLDKNQPLTSELGDTTTFENVIKSDFNIILWTANDFCQSCVFETMTELGNHLNDKHRFSPS